MPRRRSPAPGLSTSCIRSPFHLGSSNTGTLRVAENASHLPSFENEGAPAFRPSAKYVSCLCAFVERFPIQIWPWRRNAISFLSGDNVKFAASVRPAKRAGLGLTGETVQSWPSFENRISLGDTHENPAMS